MSQNISSSMIDVSAIAAALGITVEQFVAAQAAAAPKPEALKAELGNLKVAYEKVMRVFVEAEKKYTQAGLERSRLFSEYERIATAARQAGVRGVEDLPKRLTEKLAEKYATEEKAEEKQEAAEAPTTATETAPTEAPQLKNGAVNRGKRK